jgi:RecB family exonuclease
VELPSDAMDNLQERGRTALKAWLAQRGKEIAKTDRFEYDFHNEGSAIEDVRLSGKVDRLIVDEKRRRITVVDYKTGKPYKKWQASIPKLHKIRLQIYFYKFLVESSARFRGYEVERGIVEFVEPDENGRINQLVLEFDEEELKRTAALANAVWQRTKNLDFPDVSGYPPTLAGIRKFEADLIKQNARD